MLQDFMEHCCPNAPFREIVSLNQLIAPSDFSDDEPTEVGDLIADPAPSVEDKLHAASIEKHLRDFVGNLSPHLRCIAFRHFWLDQNQTEIASDLGVTRSAVCHAVRRIQKLGHKYMNPVVAL